jgi:hypothetical protein
MIDSAAKASYRQSLKDLRAELVEAEQSNDSARGEKIREQIDFIENELSGAIGLHGRDRRAASAAERARLSVTRAIKAALAHALPPERKQPGRAQPVMGPLIPFIDSIPEADRNAPRKLRHPI